MVLVQALTATQQMTAQSIQAATCLGALRASVTVTLDETSTSLVVPDLSLLDEQSDKAHAVVRAALYRIDELAAVEIGDILAQRNVTVAGIRLARWNPHTVYVDDQSCSVDEGPDSYSHGYSYGYRNYERRNEAGRSMGDKRGVKVAVGVVREWWTRGQARRDINAVERCRAKAVRCVEEALHRFTKHRDSALCARQCLTCIRV